MPEANKITKEDPKVDIDTSGPDVDVVVPEEKAEEVVETKEQETVKEETVKEIKKEQKDDDSKLEEYSKGVQSRIAKLTRKMREAERREQAATEYAQALESQRKTDQSRFKKMDTDYWSRFEKNVKTGMESAQKELANAIRNENNSPTEIAKKGWDNLWPKELRRKQALYQFGLEKLMRFKEEQLREFFKSFFGLSNSQWYGFLTNTLTINELVNAMWTMFKKAPLEVKWGLMEMKGRELKLLWNFLKPGI